MAENTSTEQAVEKLSNATASVKNVKIEFTEDSFGITKGEIKVVDAATAKRLIDAHVARAK